MESQIFSRLNVVTPEDAPHGIRELFAQSKWWRTRDQGWVRIADMSPRHRLNVTLLLLQSAHDLADRLAWSDLRRLHSYSIDAPEEVVAMVFGEMQQRDHHPVSWVRRTPLFLALTREVSAEQDA